MPARAYINGHEIRWDPEIKGWRYADGALLDEIRPCARCGQSGKNGQDACLSGLPGVRNACCGHGTKEGYIQFEDGRVLRGQFRVEKES